MDHINGINTDNRLENLRIVCPNCHSQTETYCVGNVKDKPISKKSKIPCPVCSKPMTYKALCCKLCKILTTKIEWPELPALLTMINHESFRAIAKKLGVTDNAIRKHIKQKAPLR